MAKWRWMLSAALAAMSTVATVQAQKEGQAQEEDENARAVDIEEIPAPARRAIRLHIGTGRLMEVVEKWQNGEPVYAGRITHPHGTHITVTVDAAGDVLDLKVIR
jgi:hypothetical protein